MPSDKGILARALAGGVAGGASALRKAEELKVSEFQKFQGMQEKFAWGDEVARQKRLENLQRFGQEKELAGIKSGLRKREFTHQLSATEQRKRQNVSDSISAEMNAFGASEDEIKEAVGWAQAGISRDLIRGTAGKPLSTAQAKELAETINTLYPDLEGDARTQKFKEMESRITSGTFGIPAKREGIKAARATQAEMQKMQAKVDKAAKGLLVELVSNTGRAINSFRTLAGSRPDIARETLAQIEGSGTVYGATLKELRRVLKESKPKKELIGKPEPLIGVPGRKVAPPSKGDSVLGDILKGGFIGGYKGPSTT